MKLKELGVILELFSKVENLFSQIRSFGGGCPNRLKLDGPYVQIRTMFCKNIEPHIVLMINKNNLRTFEPRECQKYKNVEPQQHLSGSYKKKKVYTIFL